MEYYILGAHSRGYTLFEYLRTLQPKDCILGFLYNNDEKNPEFIEGVNVKTIRTDSPDLNTSANVFIATRGVYHEKIIEELREIGFKNIIPITPELDINFRNLYVGRCFETVERAFDKIDSLNPSSGLSAMPRGKGLLYIAKTSFDDTFQKDVDLKVYEKIIQVGSVLSDKKMSDVSCFDNEGDNISGRNPQFCELTALYWLWKHVEDDIVGLEHWRRRFILPDNWMDIMQSNGIDVILPVPLCVMPSLLENYKSRHDSYVWGKCMEVLKKHHQEDYDDACIFFAENKLYSPCNMLIARRDVLNEYCEWLFPVLLELNDTIGTLDDKYQNRYPGFISERLLNYYFEKNRGRFRIAYADKSFLS